MKLHHTRLHEIPLRDSWKHLHDDFIPRLAEGQNLTVSTEAIGKDKLKYWAVELRMVGIPGIPRKTKSHGMNASIGSPATSSARA